MAGKPKHIEWRDEIACGQRLGPRIISSGPLLVSEPSSYRRESGMETAAGAEKIVRLHIEEGFDYIKVHDDFSANAYAYLHAAARKQNWRRRPRAGRSRHPLLSWRRDRKASSTWTDTPVWIQNDDSKQLHARPRSQVWNCPTLVAYQRLVYREDLSEQTVDFATSSSSTAALIDTVRRHWYLPDDFDLASVEYGPVPDDYLQLVYELHRAGAPLLLGTDAPSPYALPGMAIHQELENFVAAGLTPYEALLTGTVNPARFLDQIDEFGTVSEGKRAELLLLSANPLSDIRNSRQVEGVFTNGRWHAIDEIHVTPSLLAHVR